MADFFELELGLDSTLFERNMHGQCGFWGHCKRRLLPSDRKLDPFARIFIANADGSNRGHVEVWESGKAATRGRTQRGDLNVNLSI
jgi:hypothetical protein